MTNTPESKPSEPFGSNKSPEKTFGGDYLKYQIEFIDKVTFLIESLHKYATATRRVFELEFLSQEDGIYAYPEALKYRLLDKTLKEIFVSITQEGDEPSTTTIELCDEDGTVHISRDSVLSDDSFDTIIDNQGKVTTIARIPNYEINALLLSLTERYSEAEHEILLQNTQEMVVGENMIAALLANAVETTSYFEYSLSPNISVYFTMVNNTGDDKLISFRIIYNDNNQNKIAAEMKLENGLELTFRSFDDSTYRVFYPDKEDYITPIEIVVEETNRILSGLERPSVQIDYEIFENLADPDPTDS